jgi:phosphatidylserine/phosphatidylglycerophosphate/cardiolipin synthase-like enzyme
MIVDRETVITGSFNFTKAAEEKNAENLLTIKSKELAAIYIDNWKKHWSTRRGMRGGIRGSMRRREKDFVECDSLPQFTLNYQMMWG